jgi:hypothetical protein
LRAPVYPTVGSDGGTFVHHFTAFCADLNVDRRIT